MNEQRIDYSEPRTDSSAPAMSNQAPDSSKLVYFFGDGCAEGSASMKRLLGGKGANLAEMTNLGIPVPPGFTLASFLATRYSGASAAGAELPVELSEALEANLRRLEQAVGRRLGDASDPLLVSVRSGAAVSMPGMMDTILNLGLNDETVLGLEARTGDARFAWDSYRRFVQMFGDVVLGVPHHRFEQALEDIKLERGIWRDTDLDADGWKQVVRRYVEVVDEHSETGFPQDPREQLRQAIAAVFRSWDNARARSYRQVHHIAHDLGTAVSVQAMVFGNMGEDSATGVAFTRDPSTGEACFFGEYLANAQGEDVVAGIRTPLPIRTADDDGTLDGESLEAAMPAAYAQLVEIAQRLEGHYRDMQDIEFTIEQGRVWMLQTRTGKRTARAAVRIATEMVSEGLISRDEALCRIEPETLEQLLHPTLDPTAERQVLARGLPASPGAVSGRIVFTADDAEAWAERGEKVILVRTETSPEDIRGMVAAEGILTARGGLTSHAAVVARGMGKCCVAGCSALKVDAARKTARIGQKVLREGDVLTLDGGRGDVIDGAVSLIEAHTSADFDQLMDWADARRRLAVRANADNAQDAARARRLGARGIGLCRTEHMFFEGERIQAMRQLILAPDEAQRRAALEQLEPMQRQDFIGIFEAMLGLPVTIRLLDPPLHEFLPHSQAELEALARATGVPVEGIRSRAHALEESNPMLGHRGCRLGLSYPEIYDMQVRAIIDAAIEVNRRHVTDDGVQPEIMIPLVGHEAELQRLRERVEAVADARLAGTGVALDYLVGTMIELPRACLVADRIAQAADFFSFGTNDLTQTTFGISRDDAARFLPEYVSEGIYARDPFVAIDRDGVGALMEIGVTRGRRARPGLKIGICGEHGGEPSSVAFCHGLGLDYVSCSPFRVPIARLAAARAAIEESNSPDRAPTRSPLQ